MAVDAIKYALELISQKSVSCEEDHGAIDLLAGTLSKLGFENEILTFSENGTYDVKNIYSELIVDPKGKNLCFAGHTDVVPAGDESAWSVPPFSPKIVDGILIGRGAVDMKGSIASWVSAISKYLERDGKENIGTLSLLITGDEEADAINGTVKLLKYISEKGKKIDACIVGEPTNPQKLGEMMKVGRRGSVTFELTVNGIQGHVAYPDVALNPNHLLAKILSELVTTDLDQGNEYFQPSSLQVTTIDVGNEVSNLIPASAKCKINIRFNTKHTKQSLADYIEKISAKHANSFQLSSNKGNLPFLSVPKKLADIVNDAVVEVTSIKPVKSTTGGTSDARFIKDYAEVVEFGLINTTAHKIDEQIEADDIEKLSEIYYQIIKRYFA